MSEKTWEWSERLSLNHQEMDETHQEFVRLCATLLLDHEPSFLARLDALIAHSVDHFEQENGWMREKEFPLVACHQREHDTVLEVMREVRRRIVGGELDLAPRLAEELPLWFEHHVDTMDSMLARFLIEKPLGQEM